MIVNSSDGFIASGVVQNSAFVGEVRLYGMMTRKCIHHMLQAEATETASSAALLRKNGDVAYLAPPTSGGMYFNLWHQIADILFSYFVTLAHIIPLDSNYILHGDGVPRGGDHTSSSPFKRREFPTAPTATKVTWLTMTPWTTLRNGCYSQATCDEQMLFLPFTRLFHQYYFMDDPTSVQNTIVSRNSSNNALSSSSLPPSNESESAASSSAHQQQPPSPPDYLRYNSLIIGRDTQCDVYKHKEITRPLYCARALRAFNQYLLHNGDATYQERIAGVSRVGYGADRSLAPNLHLVRLNNTITTRKVTPAEVRCPQIRYVTRSKQRYRKVLPTTEFVNGLLGYFNTSFSHCLEGGLTAIDFVKPLSFNYSSPFDAQFRALQGVSMLIAGRGAITTLSIGLPDGAAYFGLAGPTDPWEPYGHINMEWVTFKHYVTKMRRPEKSKKALNPNNANYYVNVPHFIAALHTFYDEWKTNYSSWKLNS